MLRSLRVAALALAVVSSQARADLTLVNKPSRVIVILGQSQGTNSLGPTLYTIRNTSILKQINISTGALSAASEPFASVAGTTSTFFAEMADTLADSGNWSQITLAPIAIQSSYSSSWANGGANYSRITTTISQIQSLGLTVGAIIWVQGEEDAQHAENTAAIYTANIQSALKPFRDAGIRAPFIMPRETWVLSGLPTNSGPIRTAQGTANGDMRIINGPDLDLLGNDQRQDGTHFNNLGKSALAQSFAAIVARVMR